MRLSLLNDYLLVKLDSDEWLIKRPELIEIPDAFIGAYKKRASTGIVVAKGSKCSEEFKIGDRVRFPRIEQRQKYIENGLDYRFVLEHELDFVINA